MEQKITFAENFLKIARDRSAFSDNQPAQLILRAIDGYAREHGISVEKAAQVLSEKPDYGRHGAIGGVNVYESKDGKKGLVEYLDGSGESTWMNLDLLVEQAMSSRPNSAPDWFERYWNIELANNHWKFAELSEA